ncbi:hypothetical protein B0H16DRAFT_1581957, partial [Mycena metata]
MTECYWQWKGWRKMDRTREQLMAMQQRCVFLRPLFGNILNLPSVPRLFFCSAVSSTAAFNDDLHHLILLFGSAERSSTGSVFFACRHHLPFDAMIPTLVSSTTIISRPRTSKAIPPNTATSNFQATSIILALNIQGTTKYLDGWSTNRIPHSHAPPSSLTTPFNLPFFPNSFLQEPVGIIGAARFGHHCITPIPEFSTC